MSTIAPFRKYPIVLKILPFVWTIPRRVVKVNNRRLTQP